MMITGARLPVLGLSDLLAGAPGHSMQNACAFWHGAVRFLASMR
jgi:hypothetical protein